MNLNQSKVLIISHAGVRSVNRSVYNHLLKLTRNVQLIVPSILAQGTSRELKAESRRAEDCEILFMTLIGTNPRTYYYKELLSWLDVNKPSVIILENDPVSRLGIQLSKWGKRHKVPVICQTYENFSRDLLTTVRNHGWRAIPKNFILSFLNYVIASRVEALLVVNKDSELIFNRYGYKNVVRIPLGYDRNVFFVDNGRRELFRNKFSIESNTILIGYFGRLVHQKGVHLLVKALSSLKSLKWKLLIDYKHDGEDKYASYIQELITSFKMEDRIIYFEANHIEIADYMRASDIMVAPSVTTPEFKEQYGRTVQEAMACGSVSLVSDSGHLKDLVGDSRLVFRENDVESLQDLLKLFITDESMRLKYNHFLTERAITMLTAESQAHLISNIIEGLNL